MKNATWNKNKQSNKFKFLYSENKNKYFIIIESILLNIHIQTSWE